MSLNLSLVLVLAISALASFLVTSVVIRFQVLDHPNARSSHTVSTPKAGGLGIMAGVMLALGIAALFGGLAQHATQIVMLTVLGLLTGLLGFYDDLRDLPARLKFLLLALLALGVALSAYPVNHFALDQAHIALPFLVAIAGTALWVFVISNAANFMDGSDGLITVSGIIAAAALAMLALDAGQAIAALMALSLMVSLLGFLPLNMPPAKVFLGDTGALFVGFWFGGLTLFYVHDGPSGAVYAAVLVFMPWLSDVLLTLAWRLAHGRDLLTAHNDHVFQLALRAGFSHAQVALFVALQMAFCGTLAWVFRASATSELLALAAMASLAIIGHWWARAAFAANQASGDNGPSPGY